MSKLTRDVSYLPLSENLSHPGDRRRVVVWSKFFNIPIKTKLISPNDLLILSSASSLKYWTKRHKGPVVIDLVDGYLSAKPKFPEDLLRNLLRSMLSKSSYSSFTFHRELTEALSMAKAIVVSCPEQAQFVEKFNSNVHCILDDHSEFIDNYAYTGQSDSQTFTLLWEGLGYTLKHLLNISNQIEAFLINKNAKLVIVTNLSFNKWSSKFGRVETIKYIEPALRRVWNQIELVEWTTDSLKRASATSDIAVIPITAGDKFAEAKPENKLLSYWTLGLPALCSPTAAYARVLKAVGDETLLVPESRWLDALNKSYEQSKRSSLFPIERKNLYSAYLTQFHSKEVLAKKWDNVLRPLLLN